MIGLQVASLTYIEAFLKTPESGLGRSSPDAQPAEALSIPLQIDHSRSDLESTWVVAIHGAPCGGNGFWGSLNRVGPRFRRPRV